MVIHCLHYTEQFSSISFSISLIYLHLTIPNTHPSLPPHNPFDPSPPCTSKKPPPSHPLYQYFFPHHSINPSYSQPYLPTPPTPLSTPPQPPPSPINPPTNPPSAILHTIKPPTSPKERAAIVTTRPPPSPSKYLLLVFAVSKQVAARHQSKGARSCRVPASTRRGGCARGKDQRRVWKGRWEGRVYVCMESN